MHGLVQADEMVPVVKRIQAWQQRLQLLSVGDVPELEDQALEPLLDMSVWADVAHTGEWQLPQSGQPTRPSCRDRMHGFCWDLRACCASCVNVPLSEGQHQDLLLCCSHLVSASKQHSYSG